MMILKSSACTMRCNLVPASCVSSIPAPRHTSFKLNMGCNPNTELAAELP
jgi:hypothetical protein